MSDQRGAPDPGLSGALQLAPDLRERQRPVTRSFRWWSLLGALVVVAIAVTTWAAVRALTSGTPDLPYPSGPPVPAFAMVVLSDQAADFDDPMRSRQVVLDVKRESLDDLLGFYRTTYALSEGWQPTSAPSDHELCLIKPSSGGFTDIVEVFPYEGSRVPVSAGRHLVMISRMQDVGTGPCGAALPWIDSDLL